jgi:hypothetical protein
MAWRMPPSFQCLAPHHGVFLFQKDSVIRPLFVAQISPRNLSPVLFFIVKFVKAIQKGLFVAHKYGIYTATRFILTKVRNLGAQDSPEI